MKIKKWLCGIFAVCLAMLMFGMATGCDFLNAQNPKVVEVREYGTFYNCTVYKLKNYEIFAAKEVTLEQVPVDDELLGKIEWSNSVLYRGVSNTNYYATAETFAK